MPIVQGYATDESMSYPLYDVDTRDLDEALTTMTSLNKYRSSDNILLRLSTLLDRCRCPSKRRYCYSVQVRLVHLAREVSAHDSILRMGKLR